jgi:glycine cleavage system regulatory protein
VGGNIELQRSVRMAGEYAALFLVSLEGDVQARASAEERLNAMRDRSLFISVRDAVADPPSPGSKPMELIASGADQPGIIDAVTLVLFQSHVNIESMDYDVDGAPMTGEPLFRMNARLAIPADVDPSRVRDLLNGLEDELNVDILFRPAK